MIFGYLLKKSPSIFAGWQNRYFILQNNKLKYFLSSSTDAGPRGVICFDKVHTTVEEVNKDEFKFDITIKGLTRVFNLKAPDKKAYDMWIKELNAVILKSKGYKESISFTQLHENIN